MLYQDRINHDRIIPGSYRLPAIETNRLLAAPVEMLVGALNCHGELQRYKILYSE